MSDTIKTLFVELESTSEKPRKEKFEISRANRLLSIKKSAWKLVDKGFEWNGTELSKVKK